MRAKWGKIALQSTERVGVQIYRAIGEIRLCFVALRQLEKEAYTNRNQVSVLSMLLKISSLASLDQYASLEETFAKNSRAVYGLFFRNRLFIVDKDPAGALQYAYAQLLDRKNT